MKIHMMMQGKGGVGKSMAAVILAQYLSSKGQEILCVDTDPVNETFHSFTALGAAHLQIVEDNEINPRHFDKLVEMIAEGGRTSVIDNGSSAYVPLANFIFSNGILDIFRGLGHELVIHTLITGGQALIDTLGGFSDLVRQFPPETNFVVWLNPFWGTIELDGKGFEDMKAYHALKDRISAIITIPAMQSATFGYDFQAMLQKRLTFDEAVALPSTFLVSKQRLVMIRRQFYQQLDTALLL